MKTNIISLERYNTLRFRLEHFNQWLGDRTNYNPKDVPAGCQISNEERADIEIFEFVNNPPKKYFAYVKILPDGLTAHITTWTGQVLGVACLGKKYRTPGFWRHSTRRNILSFKAINGQTYSGVYYESAGDYCRLKISKKH